MVNTFNPLVPITICSVQIGCNQHTNTQRHSVLTKIRKNSNYLQRNHMLQVAADSQCSLSGLFSGFHRRVVALLFIRGMSLRLKFYLNSGLCCALVIQNMFRPDVFQEGDLSVKEEKFINVNLVIIVHHCFVFQSIPYLLIH